MNYPLSDCHSCGNTGATIKGCQSCGEPYNYSSKQPKDCDSYRRTNECYRPKCMVHPTVNGIVSNEPIDAYNEKYRECPSKPAQCKGCSNSGCCTANCHGCRDGGGFCHKSFRESEQKKIWKQVRVDSSLYMMNLAALTVYETPKPPTAEEWGKKSPREKQEWIATHFNRSFKKGVRSQMSDRLQLSNRALPGKKNPYVIPSRGNTTRGTTTANRPGASRPGGIGVDVKHDSYARYLARKKGKVLSKSKQPSKPIRGNKSETYNIINKNCCPVTIPTYDTPCMKNIINYPYTPTLPCNPPGIVEISGNQISFS